MSIFRRLLGFLKPYRAGAVWSLVLAALAMVSTVAIPWLTGRAIDGLEAGDKGDLRRFAALIALAAVLRVSFSVARRLVAGRVSLAIEFDLRNLIYRHLQSLEPFLAMHDRDLASGLTDAPWPPVYPKMPGEPPRVAPSRAKKATKKPAKRATKTAKTTKTTKKKAEG